MPTKIKLPKFADKYLGYAFGILKDLFNGIDTGAGLVKIAITLALSVSFVGIKYIPWVLGGGLAFGGLFVLKAALEEYLSNQKESETITKRELLQSQFDDAKEELLRTLGREIESLDEIRALKIEAALQNKTEAEIKQIVQDEVNKELRERYPFLFENPRIGKKTNQLLLKVLLNDYFAKLGPQKPNGHYEGDGKLFKAIQKVTGLNPYAPEFHREVLKWLKDDPALQKTYQRIFPASLAPEPRTFLTFVSDLYDNAAAFLKRQKRLRRVVNFVLSFGGDVAAGSGLATSLLRAFSVITPTSIVTWPLIAVIGVAGLVFGGISFTYNRARNEARTKNIHRLKKEIEQIQIQTLMYNRLKKTHKRSLGHEFHEQQPTNLPAPAAINYDIPISIKVRMGLGVLGNVITTVASSLGFVLGIAWIAHVIAPVVPYVAITLYAGGGLSPLFLFSSLKKEVTGIKAELAKMKELAELRHAFKDKYTPEQLQQDNRALLADALANYIKFIKSRGGDAVKNAEGKYPKQGKIFQLLEEVSGANRLDEVNKTFSPIGNDLFYDRVAKYLKGKNEESAHANGLVQEFKNLFMPASPVKGFTNKPVDANNPDLTPKFSKLRRFITFFKDNALPVIGVVSLAVMLPLFLITAVTTPPILLVAAVAAPIIGAALLQTYASRKSKANVTELNQEISKYHILDRKAKLEKLSQHQSAKGAITNVRAEYQPQAQKLKVANQVASSSRVISVNPQFGADREPIEWHGPAKVPPAEQVAKRIFGELNPRIKNAEETEGLLPRNSASLVE